MKKFLLSVVALMATFTASAQFTANPAELTIAAGEEKEVVFSLATSVEVTAYNLYIQCPDGIQIATRMNEDDEEELAIDLIAARHKSTHALTAGEVSGEKGTYMIAVASSKNALLRETSGEVVSVKFKATADVVDGAITIKDALAGTPGGDKFKFDNFDIKVNPTAINAISADQTKSGVIYNLAGQRVSKAVKGIYVVDGKKVAVK